MQKKAQIKGLKRSVEVSSSVVHFVSFLQCFYAHLPERLATFTADLTEMFPAGIYDTKHVTKFELCFTASYLEYAYKKWYQSPGTLSPR